MFGFKKRKIKQQIAESEEQPFLKLPLIDETDFSPATIAEYINNDVPVVAVFDPTKKMETNGKWNINALIGAQMNGLNPSVSMYRKEGPFLCDYKAYTTEADGILHFVLYNVYEMKNSNIMYLYNNDLKDACELYHDDAHLMATQQYYMHDFTEQEGLDFFRNNPSERCIYIGHDRLIKKSDTNL